MVRFETSKGTFVLRWMYPPYEEIISPRTNPITVCEVLTPSGRSGDGESKWSLYSHGEVKLHRSCGDVWNKEIARRKSLTKALKLAGFSKPERQAAWQAYWGRKKTLRMFV